MVFAEHIINGLLVAELIADDVVISTVEEGTDLIGNLYYQHYSALVLHQKNVAPDFFNLRTGVAGEILQKFSNYRIRLFILGDLEHFESKSLRDFMYESNRGAQVNFVPTMAEVENRLLRR